MALNTHEQFHTLLTEKKHVLITAPKNPSGDALASACALAVFLQQTQNIHSDIVIDGYTKQAQFNFLPEYEHIQPSFPSLKQFILNIDVKKTGVKELSYDLKDDMLRIFVTPKSGALSKQHITTAETTYKYDAIIVLDADDLSSLGALYEDHTAMFFSTPIINISHSASNEHFGQINLVDVTAVSTAEIIYGAIMSFGKEHISESIAEALLTGMISKTHSFKQKNVTPKALNIASKLIRLGANRDHIIDALYRTRSLTALKLWGEALTQLQSRDSLVWSTLTREAFSRSGAKESDLNELIEELISTTKEAHIIFILHEHHDTSEGIHGILVTQNGQDARTIIQELNPIGDKRQVSFFVKKKTLKETEEMLTNMLTKI